MDLLWFSVILGVIRDTMIILSALVILIGAWAVGSIAFDIWKSRRKRW